MNTCCDLTGDLKVVHVTEVDTRAVGGMRSQAHDVRCCFSAADLFASTAKFLLRFRVSIDLSDRCSSRKLVVMTVSKGPKLLPRSYDMYVHRYSTALY